MLKILLACNAGMSTSMLVSKMQKAAEAKGLEAKIEAKPISEAEMELDDWDIVMLGPQVRHMLKTLTKKQSKTPIEIINMRDYGTMNGENVLNAALKTLNK